MTSRQSDWSIEETTIALSLYAVTFSSQIHVRNPQIIALSSMIQQHGNHTALILTSFCQYILLMYSI